MPRLRFRLVEGTISLGPNSVYVRDSQADVSEPFASELKRLGLAWNAPVVSTTAIASPEKPPEPLREELEEKPSESIPEEVTGMEAEREEPTAEEIVTEEEPEEQPPIRSKRTKRRRRKKTTKKTKIIREVKQ